MTKLNDLLIAAHALALGLTLVTAHPAEFLRIPDLPVENWLTV
jgi:tRNA(fMet)-specific endonuclease VapC